MAKKTPDMVNVSLPRKIVDSIDQMAQYMGGVDTDRTSVAAALIIRGAKSVEAEMLAGKRIKVSKKIWTPRQR